MLSKSVRQTVGVVFLRSFVIVSACGSDDDEKHTGGTGGTSGTSGTGGKAGDAGGLDATDGDSAVVLDTVCSGTECKGYPKVSQFFDLPACCSGASQDKC